MGRLAGVPLVVNTVHGLYATTDDRLAHRAIVYILEAIAARFSRVQLVQNPEDLALLTRYRISPPHKTQLLSNGVEVARFRPGSDEERARVRRELGVHDDQVGVGFVGRLVEEEGLPELFEARRRLPEEVELIVIGPEDPEKSDALPATMIDDARHHGVRFLGHRDDVDVLYRGLGLFCLPSDREGFLRAAMEAAASGLPVLATDLRGCRQVVEDGHTGLLVAVRDIDALAAALAELVGDPQLRQDMGRAATALAHRHFEERRVVERVIAAYRDACASGADLGRTIS